MDLRVFALVAVLAIGGVVTVSATYSDAAVSEDTADVEINVSHDEWINLLGTNIQGEMVEDADGQPLNESDYEIRSGSGEILFNSSGSTTAGETVTANYTADVPAELAQSWAGPLGSITGLFGVLTVVIAASVVLASLISAKGRIGRGGL